MPSRATAPLLAPATLPPAADQPPAISALAGPDLLPLSFEILTDAADRVEALRLVADSIAQQRQQAARALALHPACVAAFAVALAAVWRLTAARDLSISLSACCGVLSAYLLTIRYLTGGYIARAEALTWAWLQPAPVPDRPDPDDDTILGARFGRNIIAALVLRFDTTVARGSRIRAWTSRLRYRGKGVGGDMLREAVRLTKERCGRDATVAFAADHANSAVFLPEMFNRPLRRRERLAARALDAALTDWAVAEQRELAS